MGGYVIWLKRAMVLQLSASVLSCCVAASSSWLQVLWWCAAGGASGVCLQHSATILYTA